MAASVSQEPGSSGGPPSARVITTFTHIRTLLWKNWILKKRHPVATCLEVLLPLMFIILMSGLKTLSTDMYVPPGWSADTPSETNRSMGTSISLFDPQGRLNYLNVPFNKGTTVPNRIVYPETTMSGFLLGLAMRSASELREMSAADQRECLAAIMFFGSVSTDINAATVVPKKCQPHTTPYRLGIAPDTDFTRKYFLETMKKWHPRTPITKTKIGGASEFHIPAFEDSVMFFKTEAEMEAYVKQTEYGQSFNTPKLYAAIVFDQYPTGDDIGKFAPIEYTIRMNSTQGRGGVAGDIPRTMGEPPAETPFNKFLTTGWYARYAARGFMTLQTLVTRFVNCMPEWDATAQTTTGKCQRKQTVAKADPDLDARLWKSIQDDVFIRTAVPLAFAGNKNAYELEMNSLTDEAKEALLVPLRQAPQSFYETSVAGLPIRGFTNSPFYNDVKDFFPLVFILAYLYAVSRILVVFIQEKETRAREYMKILGVKENSIVLAWYITYSVILFIACILQAIASKAGLFSASDPVIIFFFFFLFSMSILAYGFCVSTVFSRARTGSFAGMVLFFFMYFASTAFTSSTPRSTKNAACLLPPVAMAFGIQSLAVVEASGVGMNGKNAAIVADNFSFDTALYMMFFDFILYTLLGMYLERVIPKEYGTTEKWYFPLSPSFWSRSFGKTQKVNDIASNVEGLTNEGNPNVEKVTSELQQQERNGEALVIRDIKKEFPVPGGVKRAVKGVSLAMYKDQITCLLGHNGAGKTTLISMLTGIIAPSDGDAFFRGLSLTQDMGEIRQSLGLCFQHDVLYAEMSVEEHLKFYGRIKGYSGQDLVEVVDTKIREVGLTEKRKVFSASLSGGMKRKLSVAISLLGDSYLVFLDEPTSGMDPYSRRSTWEILLNNRPNRVMVLTTHFMDEADILGDRIAIMAEGELRCCGSSLFLKNRFGAGYNFTLVKRDQCNENALIDFIKQRVSGAQVLSNVGAEIAFQLPLDASSQFADLFEALDGQLDSIGVLSYGISVTTLEEVFIKVAEAGDEHNQHTLNKDGMKKDSTASPAARAPAIENLQGWQMFMVHLYALLLKRFRVSKRDRKVLIFSAILPIALLTMGLVFLNTSSLNKPDLKIPLDAEKGFLAGTNMMAPYYCQANEGKWCSTAMDNHFIGGRTEAISTDKFGSPPYAAANPVVFGVEYKGLKTSDSDGHLLRMGETMLERATGTKSDGTSLGITPVDNQYGGYLIYGSEQDNTIGYFIYQNSTTMHGALILKALIDQAMYRFFAADGAVSSDVSLKVNNYPLPFTSSTEALLGSFISLMSSIFIVIAFAYFPASIVSFLVKEKQPEHNSKHQQLVSGVSLPAFWLANYIWDMLMYMIPFIAALVLIQVFDISTMTGNGCSSCTDNVFAGVVVLFLLFGLAICPFTYCMSYLFRDHASAQTYTIMANFLFGVVLIIVSFMLDVVSESSKDANEVLKYFWRLSPLYNLGFGLLNLSISELRASLSINKDGTDPFNMDVMGWEMVYLCINAVLFFAIAVGIDFLLSFPKIKAAVFKDPAIQDEPYEEDDDVKKEAERVQNGGAANDMVRLEKIRKVYKGNKVAVRNLSFGLPKGECFGYLGINGAGKTTTMKMLTGDIIPTSGNGALGGLDILTQQIQVRRLIGYCPQFDALFELLSVREHLELFALIKGVPRKDLAAVVGDLIKQMNLEDFEHKLAGTLSGGNKRKLSVAIALIGSPPIIFLDEPSTGMDPVSRRFMWNVIADISTQRKESTIILTTHSMEECEALCTRVGIMVGGRLRCLGSIQHLKNRFGNGLMVELKLDQPTSDEIDAHASQHLSESATTITRDTLRALCERLGNAAWAEKVTPKHSTGYAIDQVLTRDGKIRPQLFSAWWMSEQRFEGLDGFLRQSFGDANVQLLERQNDMCRYKLLGDAQELRLSNVFRIIENGKADHAVREYAVSQTTLEQIFNFFASQQSEEKGVARGMASK